MVLLEFLDAIVALSTASPSAGWVAGVIGVHPWQLALFSDEAQQEMWGQDPQRMHSSSYNPTGKVRRVAGGYLAWGRWSFSSGCDHCQGVNVGALLRDPDAVAGPPEYRSFVVYPDQYEIEDTWHVAGLKGGTGEGFDHATALTKAVQPTLFLHAKWFRAPDGRLLGALDDDDVARVRSLIGGAFDYVRLDCGDATALEVPGREAQEIRAFEARHQL